MSFRLLRQGVLLFQLFTFAFLQAQCPEGGVLFIDQASVDQFGIDYPDCTDIHGDLLISPLVFNNITDLSPLENISVIRGSLAVSGQVNLTSLSGLENLDSIQGYLAIENNPQLTNLEPLSQLHYINKAIYIDNNDSLRNLVGLESIDYLTEGIYITDNDALESLQGIENIRLPTLTAELEIDTTASIQISNNSNLLSLDYFPAVDTIGRFLILESNPRIKNLLPLNTVSSVAVLYLDKLDSLESLNGLEELKRIGAFLNISFCPELVDLEGLKGLSYLAYSLSIANNTKLESLIGMGDFETAESDGKLVSLTITDNPQLSYCHIDPVCRAVAHPGDYSISNNLTTCVDEPAVETACMVGLSAISDFPLQIYPNPAQDQMMVSTPMNDWAEKLTLLDLNGRKLIEQKMLGTATTVYIRDLSNGLYYVQLFDRQHRLLAVEKVLIIN